MPGGFFDGHALGLAPDVGDGDRPEGDEIDSRDELGEERGQEFPVPSQQADQQGRHAEIEDVVRGRERAFDKGGKDGDLEDVGHDRQKHGGHELRAGRDGDGIVRHTVEILDDLGAGRAAYLGGVKTMEGRYTAAPSLECVGVRKSMGGAGRIPLDAVLHKGRDIRYISYTP